MNKITTKAFFLGSEKDAKELQLNISQAEPNTVNYCRILINYVNQQADEPCIGESNSLSHLLILAETQTQEKNLECKKPFVFAMSQEQLKSLAEMIASKIDIDHDGGTYSA